MISHGFACNVLTREEICYTKIITYAWNFLYYSMIHTCWQDSVTSQYRCTSRWNLSTKLNEYFLLQVQASVRKLADSIQTVKTVLGMKIQSEQKLVSILLSHLYGRVDLLGSPAVILCPHYHQTICLSTTYLTCNLSKLNHILSHNYVSHVQHLFYFIWNCIFEFVSLVETFSFSFLLYMFKEGIFHP